MKSLVTFLIIFCGLCGVNATVWYVDGEAGCDTNAGQREEAAFVTIQRAVDVANPGDTILVAPGIYHERITIKAGGRADAPLTIKAIDGGMYKTVITGAVPEVRNGAVTWIQDEENVDVYWIPFDYRPVRVLVDRVDLLAYQRVEHLLSQAYVEDDYPANRGGFAWDPSTHRLYIRLDDEIHGDIDPNRGTVAVAPPTAGGRWGSDPNREDNFLISLRFQGSAHVIIDGFTFETPGLSAVYTEADDLVVRNGWFFGCRYGVMGSNDASTHRVTVEHCFYTQYPAFSDIVAIVRQKEGWPKRKDGSKSLIMHWQRKGGVPPVTRGVGSDHSYETGLVRRMGVDWTVRANWLWEVFEGFSSGSVALSRDSRIIHNRIERVCDNAAETEEHAFNLTIAYNLIIDAFEAISWQPLNGFPFPGPIYVHDNVIIQTPECTELWKRFGNNGGVFKIGAKDERNWKIGGKGMTPENITSAPGGFWVTHNTVVSRQGRMFTALNPPDRLYENFYFLNNLIETRYFSQYIGGPWEAGDIFFAHNAVCFTEGFEEDMLVAAGEGGCIVPEGLIQDLIRESCLNGAGDGHEMADLEIGLTKHRLVLPGGEELDIPSVLPLRARVGAESLVDNAGPEKRGDAVVWINSLPVTLHHSN